MNSTMHNNDQEIAKESVIEQQVSIKPGTGSDLTIQRYNAMIKRGLGELNTLESGYDVRLREVKELLKQRRELARLPDESRSDVLVRALELSEGVMPSIQQIIAARKEVLGADCSKTRRFSWSRRDIRELQLVRKLEPQALESRYETAEKRCRLKETQRVAAETLIAKYINSIDDAIIAIARLDCIKTWPESRNLMQQLAATSKVVNTLNRTIYKKSV
ncbi:hypothetical protein [Novipirellula sp.]|uniref:hypothetical protein n=1 Tax=Novipirellula sp. TaxID=2795430 RepID=UPI003563DD29